MQAFDALAQCGHITVVCHKSTAVGALVHLLGGAPGVFGRCKTLCDGACVRRLLGSLSQCGAGAPGLAKNTPRLLGVMRYQRALPGHKGASPRLDSLVSPAQVALSKRVTSLTTQPNLQLLNLQICYAIL